MKLQQLFWHRKSPRNSGINGGKYKPVRLILAETAPEDALHALQDGDEYILSVHKSVQPGSKLQVPTFISPRQRRRESRLLRTTGCFLGACGCLGCPSCISRASGELHRAI